MKKIITITFLLFFGLSTHSWAVDLSEAKSLGLVGETPTGYLEAVTSPSGEIKALINDINAKRKQHYQQIANKNGTPLQVVEKLAGQTAIKKTDTGNYIKVGGQWTKR